MDATTKERLIRLAEEEIPIHKHFGLKVDTVEKDFIRVRVPFRKDLVGDIRTNHWHGGIIATILDSVGGAIGIANFNSAEDKLSTIDLRVDYLRFADGKDLIFEGKLVRMGNRIMVTKMKAFQEDVLVAEGKGVYNFIRSKK
ncbi:hotdog fold thioesterase [Kordia algicida OT-1]|uniref:Phenylacetic acid degradation-related protein n=1 Tax=Kordia algicida OT-1 TaxID=391587 RepID=A9DJ28_9FLAO|nr:hotdog fold thioesterase [Kordia algicida]EDP98016.1 Phenylacetic acid degradation-related protein [Kordia algicida OT-1]